MINTVSRQYKRLFSTHVVKSPYKDIQLPKLPLAEFISSQWSNIPNIHEYRKKIKKIKSYLKLGETYQINYSNPIKYSYNQSKFELYLYFQVRPLLE